MTRISVIVPVYKVEAYLPRCVDSICRQTFADFTLILVDDGSPDGCGALCDAYARRDSRIRVIHQENGGLSAARNAGIDWALNHMDCQWLAFVDSDDWVHPSFLQTLLEGAESTGCCLSACGFCRTQGEPLPQPQGDFAVLDADDYYCGVSGGVAPVAWNKLYHRSLFANLRYPVGKLHEDEFTTYRAVYQAGKVAVTTAGLYAYYQNPEGIIRSRWNPRRLHALEAFREQIAFARETGGTRLEQLAAKQLIFTIHEQLPQVDKTCLCRVRQEYRRALKLARQCGAFHEKGALLWAYEEAYPCKVFWWLLMKGKREEKK